MKPEPIPTNLDSSCQDGVSFLGASYSDAMERARQMIFGVAKELRAMNTNDPKLVATFLDSLKLYENALQNSGNMNAAQKTFDVVQKKLLGIRNEIRQQSSQLRSNEENASSWSAAKVMVTIGTLLLSGSAGLASANLLKFGTAVMSFAVLMFMIGATIITADAGIARRYLAYMWIAALVIIGTLTVYR